MEIIILPQADEDLIFFTKTGNKPILKKITQLISEIIKDPFQGIGKPEALKYELLGKWSRRINKEHRLIYEVDEISKIIYIHSLKGHY